MTSKHECDERCVCPIHGTPMIYWPFGDDHACQDATCQYGYGGDPYGVWAERLLTACRTDRPVRLRRRSPEERRAYLAAKREEMIAKGIDPELFDLIVEATQ